MQPAAGSANVRAVAVTKAIELRTGYGAALEGDPRAQGARRCQPAVDLPADRDRRRARRDADRRRREHVHRLHGRDRLPQRRPLASTGRCGRAGAARALLAHRLHDRPLRGLHHARERLCALSPIRGAAKAAFFNSGAEAVENAIKFARSYTGRPALIAFEGGFHGRTLLAMSNWPGFDSAYVSWAFLTSEATAHVWCGP